MRWSHRVVVAFVEVVILHRHDAQLLRRHLRHDRLTTVDRTLSLRERNNSSNKLNRQLEDGYKHVSLLEGRARVSLPVVMTSATLAWDCGWEGDFLDRTAVTWSETTKTKVYHFVKSTYSTVLRQRAHEACKATREAKQDTLRDSTHPSQHRVPHSLQHKPHPHISMQFIYSTCTAAVSTFSQK